MHPIGFTHDSFIRISSNRKPLGQYVRSTRADGHRLFSTYHCSSPHRQPIPQTTPQPRQQLPTSDQFVAQLPERQSQPPMPAFRGPFELANYPAETGQENEPLKMITARDMAQATTGIYASRTATMAYHLATGNYEAFWAEKFGQRTADEATCWSSTNRNSCRSSPSDFKNIGFLTELTYLAVLQDLDGRNYQYCSIRSDVRSP